MTMTPLTESDPRRLGAYQLVGRLGSGGFGVVYEAQAAEGARVAIKLLRSEFSDDEGIRARLAREAEALARVVGDRTVQIIEVVVGDSDAYLVMEFVEGESLDELVRRTGKLEGPMLWFAAQGLVEALATIHRAGIVHRDLKPSNVMYGPDGVKVLDFGISAVADEAGLTQTGTLLGSAAWLSPEQVRGGRITNSSDVFNLGLILAFAALGRHPFGEGRADAIMYRIANSDPDLDGLGPPLRDVVGACLQQDPARRPTVDELNAFFDAGGDKAISSVIGERAPSDRTYVVSPAALASAVESHDAEAVGDGSAPTPPRRTRKAKLLISLLGAAVLVASGVVIADATNVLDVGFVGNAETGQDAPLPTVVPTTVLIAATVPSTTVRIAPTTTTPRPAPPAYKVGDDEGQSYRWDPCGAPVSIYINPMNRLSSDETRAVALFLAEQVRLITEMSGIPTLYRGVTNKVLNATEESNKKEILLQFELSAVGYDFEDQPSDLVALPWWTDGRKSGGFIERLGAGIAIDSKLIVLIQHGENAGTLLWKTQQELMHFLGRMYGLEDLSSDDMAGFGVPSNQYNGEIMYWEGEPSAPPEWGEGDKIGMRLVGANNGCF
jgi:predicted Ser/Thr protein kinase